MSATFRPQAAEMRASVNSITPIRPGVGQLSHRGARDAHNGSPDRQALFERLGYGNCEGSVPTLRGNAVGTEAPQWLRAARCVSAPSSRDNPCTKMLSGQHVASNLVRNVFGLWRRRHNWLVTRCWRGPDGKMLTIGSQP